MKSQTSEIRLSGFGVRLHAYGSNALAEVQISLHGMPEDYCNLCLDPDEAKTLAMILVHARPEECAAMATKLLSFVNEAALSDR